LRMPGMRLTENEVRRLGEAAGMPVPEGDLAEVTLALNVSLSVLRRIRELPLSQQVPAAYYPDVEQP